MTIVCEPDQHGAAALAALVGGPTRTVARLAEAVAALVADPAEAVLVLGPGVDAEQALRLATTLRQEQPAVAVLLLRDSVDFRVLARATAAGIREVLTAGDGGALAAACRRWQAHAARHAEPMPATEPGPDGQDAQAARAAPAPNGPARRGRVVTVLAAKGGTGKTTLAINLAVVLSAAGHRVCLVDLDLGFGDVAGVLRLDPRRTLIDAAGLDLLDPVSVATLVTPYRPRLDTILAPVGPGEPERVRPELVGALLAVLPTAYDYVIVDTAARLTATVLAALDASAHHVLLSTPELPALRNLRRTLDVLDLLSYDRHARSVVFNRSDVRTGLMVADIEDTVRSPVAAHIPTSPDVPVSVNRGVPLAAAEPDHPVSRAIRRLAERRLAGVGGDPPRHARPA